VGGNGVLQAVHDGLVVDQFALGHQPGQMSDRLREAVDVIEDQEPAHGRPLHEDLVDVALALPVFPGAQIVVLGDHAAEHDSCPDVQAHEDVVHDLPAHVLEVDVDAVHRRPVEFVTPVGSLVVDTGVEAEVLDHVVALCPSAGDAHDTGATSLGDLTCHGTGGTGGGRNDDGFTRSGLPDVHTEIGGEARDAEYTEEGGQGCR
jgi:hypothetical protein